MDKMNLYLIRTIKEVRDVLRMDRQEAACRYSKNAQDVDRFLMDKATALLDAVSFFLGMDSEDEHEEVDKPDAAE